MTTMHLSSETRRVPFGLDQWVRSLRSHICSYSISFHGLIILAALFSFELFNFSTTEFALLDLLGELTFLGIRWSVILALAFCGIDFAGIARLLKLDLRSNHSFEIWYLLGAWLLAAAMNAMLSWWSISLALISHEGLGNEILGRDVLVSSVPVFVALLIVLIRILIIGTLSLSGSSLIFSRSQQASQSSPSTNRLTPAAPAVRDSRVQSGNQRQAPAPGASRIPSRAPMSARASHRR